MKQTLILILFFLASCSSDSFKRTPAKTTFTTIKVADNVRYNRYIDITARRLEKDTFRVKGSSVQWYRDTFYWALRNITDTVNKRDSIDWVPVPKEAIVNDYNMSWK